MNPNETHEYRQRLKVNPDPLKATDRRDNVTVLAAVADVLKARTRADRLRVWLALGGTETEFDAIYSPVCPVCGSIHAADSVCHSEGPADA